MRSVLRVVENSVGNWLQSSQNSSDFGLFKADVPAEEKSPDKCSERKIGHQPSLKENSNSFEYPKLKIYLNTLGLEKYIDEISEIITVNLTGTKSLIENKDITAFSKWIKDLKFLEERASDNANAFTSECIDGHSFMLLQEQEWQELNLDPQDEILLRATRDGLLKKWDRKVLCLLQEDKPSSITETLSTQISSPNMKYSTTTASMSTRISRHRHSNSGLIYGQLVVLGYKEYRVNGLNWTPMGLANEKFILRRRIKRNGISRANHTYNSPKENHHRFLEQQLYRHESCSPRYKVSFPGSSPHTQRVTIDFEADPTKDLFQLGRMQVSQNDFILRGPLHADGNGVLCGPVSRFACRIECERLPPFRSFIYAGGFNEKQELFLSENAPICNNIIMNDGEQGDDGKYLSQDALTTFGIRIWRPDATHWHEISVLGNAYGQRPSSNTAGPRIIPMEKKSRKIKPEKSPTKILSQASYKQTRSLGQNELVEGTIIDIAGIFLIFQSAHTSQRKLTMEPNELFQKLNNLRPQCPVLMHTIKFTHISHKQRIAKAVRRMTVSGEGMVPTGSFHIPPVDQEDVQEDRRPYVFPACGHVHAYSKALEGRPCPLCRRVGAFTPLIFPFEASICNHFPTHVFNPCGHAASRETCEFWANLPTADSCSQMNRARPFCPFCACPLETEETRGGPFSKLILQFVRTANMSSNTDVWSEIIMGDGKDIPASSSLKTGSMYSYDDLSVDDMDVDDEAFEDRESEDEAEKEEERALVLQQLMLRRELMSSDMDERSLPYLHSLMSSHPHNESKEELSPVPTLVARSGESAETRRLSISSNDSGAAVSVRNGTNTNSIFTIINASNSL